MDVILDTALRFPAAPDPVWWRDPSTFIEVCDALRGAGLWFDFQYAGRAGKQLTSMRTPAQLAKWSSQWDERVTYAVSTVRDGSLRATTLTFAPSPAPPGDSRAGFNALGDELVLGQFEPKPPFALHDAAQQFACVGVGAWADGRVDPADEQQLAALRRESPLPIARLAALVQSREVAIAAYDRLRRAGADTALYPSADGSKLWDPWPRGLWLSP